MTENVYEVAAKAKNALRRMTPRLERVRVVSAKCEICGKTHRMGLGEPRCSEVAKREREAERAIFDKALALAALLACLGFSGCAGSHYYVSGVTVGAGETGGDGKEITAGLTIAPNPYTYPDAGKQAPAPHVIFSQTATPAKP